MQVKSGGVKRSDIATLNSDLQREKAAMGLLITLEPPSAPMNDEAAQAGAYHSPYDGKNYPKIQILTVEEILRGAEIKMPSSQIATYKQAQRVKTKQGKQRALDW